MWRELLIALAAVSVASAQIETVPYISIGGGLGLVSDTELRAMGVDFADISFNEGYVVEAAAGIRLDRGVDNRAIRLEAAVSYQENDVDQVTDILGVMGSAGLSYPDDSTAKATAVMFTGYLDFPTAWGVTPYALAGIGGVHLDVEVDDDDVFAGQLGAGIAYPLSQNLILDLKYAYILTEKIMLLNVAQANISGHRLQAGLRVEF